jgi:hypothetical protein
MSAAIQTSRFVNSHLAFAGQAQVLATNLGVLEKALGIVLGTTVFTVFTLVQTKE